MLINYKGMDEKDLSSPSLLDTTGVRGAFLKISSTRGQYNLVNFLTHQKHKNFRHMFKHKVEDNSTQMKLHELCIWEVCCYVGS